MGKDPEVGATLFEAEKRFSECLRELGVEIRSCIAISESAIGGAHNRRQGWVLYLLSKFILHLISIESLMRFPLDFPANAQAMDHFSVAGIGRAALETAVMAMYISDNKEDDRSWALREFMLEMHDISNRSRMFKAGGKGYTGKDKQSISVMLKRYSEDIKNIQCRIQGDTYFKTLPKEQQKDILAGRLVHLGGFREAVRAAEWSPDEFDFYRSYFSSFLHAHPVSFFRADYHEVDFHNISRFQFDLCSTVVSAVQNCCPNFRERVKQFCDVQQA
jgi:hypothetical protein